jgi:hypothetical protein
MGERILRRAEVDYTHFGTPSTFHGFKLKSTSIKEFYFDGPGNM